MYLIQTKTNKKLKMISVMKISHLLILIDQKREKQIPVKFPGMLEP